MTSLRIADRPRGWWPVLTVAVGTFVIVTTEFLPIGLLSGMARDLAVTPGEAGALVTMPGAVAALAAPLGMVFAGGTDRRLLLLGFTALVVLSNILVACAQSLEMALVGRALLGVSVGGFWTFAAAVGRWLVRPEDGNRATAVVMSGISVGTVVGVPLGSALGHLLDWRFSFLAVAGVALGVFVAQAIMLPSLKLSSAQSLTALTRTLRHPRLRKIFIGAALVAAGQFTAYTFLEPMLAQGAGANPARLGWLLSAYGGAGIVGAIFGEKLVARSPALGFLAVTFVLAGAIVSVPLSLGSPSLTIVTVITWGAAFGAVPVCLQIWLHAAAPQTFEASSAVMVTVFQLSLASGAILGGVMADHLGLSTAFQTAALLILLCALLNACGLRQAGIGGTSR